MPSSTLSHIQITHPSWEGCDNSLLCHALRWLWPGKERGGRYIVQIEECGGGGRGGRGRKRRGRKAERDDDSKNMSCRAHYVPGALCSPRSFEAAVLIIIPILQICKLKHEEVTRLKVNQIPAWKEHGSVADHFHLSCPPCWCSTSPHKHVQVPHFNKELFLHLVHNRLLLLEFFALATNCLEKETYSPYSCFLNSDPSSL